MEKYFTATETVRHVVIGMAEALPFRSLWRQASKHTRH
jgi:hypothetical protein